MHEVDAVDARRYMGIVGDANGLALRYFTGWRLNNWLFYNNKQQMFLRFLAFGLEGPGLEVPPSVPIEDAKKNKRTKFKENQICQTNKP